MNKQLKFKDGKFKIMVLGDIHERLVIDNKEDELKQKIWEDIKEINKGLPTYKHIKQLIITTEPMIKTTTNKVKRNEEIKLILSK